MRRIYRGTTEDERRQIRREKIRHLREKFSQRNISLHRRPVWSMADQEAVEIIIEALEAYEPPEVSGGSASR